LDLAVFPAINATLNASSGLLLLLGYYFIRRKNIQLHSACMIAACVTSVLFLSCYLYYHFHHGSTRFQGEGVWRVVYFSILISHTILAVVIVPMVIRSLVLGLKRQDENHRRIARKTFPLWVYVSITGVVIYVMLYRMNFGADRIV